MKTTIKIFLYTLSVLLLAWILPWVFYFLVAKPTGAPFTVYSCITNCFVYIDSDKEKGVEYKDMKGNSYTEEEFDAILPFFYYRQLAAKDRLPDSIGCVPVAAASIRRSNFYARWSARDVNFTAPRIYMMMESIPSHVDLEEPVEAFRMADGGMTIMRMVDNSVDDAKSKLFTKVLNEKGFAFPMKAMNGNPTTKKEYDEGYIMIDNNYQVFHVKQMRGRPYIKKVGVDTSLKMKHVLITEFPGKKTLALLTDESNRFYALTPEYELHLLPLKYNPDKESMMIIGDMLHWTVKISNNDSYSIYALDANTYELVDSIRYDYPEEATEKVAAAIFPFTLSFTSGGDKWVKPRFEKFSATAIIFNILLAIGYVVMHHREVKAAWPYAGGIVLLGVFAFIPFLIIRK